MTQLFPKNKRYFSLITTTRVARPSDIEGGVLFVTKKPNDPQDELAGYGRI